MQDKRGPNTRAVHGGRSLDPVTGAVVPSIVMSTTFARDERGELVGGYLYGRHGNPNRRALEVCLADLEGAEDAMAFGSGCAVAHAVASALGAHDRLVVGDDMYFGIRALVRRLAERGHFELREIDLRDATAFEGAKERPRGRLVVMAETPTNPLIRVIDVAALADRVHAAGGELVVDNTMATPVLQRPLELGADYVMHSTTKFVGGHSDVIGGALLCKNASSALWADIAEVRQVGGAVPSPFDCWLLLRSLSTVVLRVERQAQSAQAIAEMLSAHPAVEEVLYPGLPSHPEHAIANAQMRLPGAMLSVLLRGGESAAASFVAALRLITVATSLGGVHTLAEHRARIEGPESTTPRNLVRMSVGIEDLADLERDVAGALGSL